MASSPKTADRADEKRHLAALIDAALVCGQRGDGTREQDWTPWTNQRFADKIFAAEAAIRSWRDPDNPTPPRNIVPLLKAFYGDSPKFAAARNAMRLAWRRAKGIADDDAPGSPPRAIETKRFSDVVEVVDLAISQPIPDNNGNLIVPYSLRIHPDKDCAVKDLKVEIGVVAPYFFVESKHWQPSHDSVFRGKEHPHVKSVGSFGAIQLVEPVDGSGRIDGLPLGSEPRERMEPLADAADGPITFSVRAGRDAFSVTPHGVSDVLDAQKKVLDALFGDAFPKDTKNRLILASGTVQSRAVKRPE